MAKLRKEYNYTRDRQIWRLLPTDTGKMVIEERDLSTKEVFFNCIEMSSGKKIFHNVQIEEKFWTGVELIYKDVIFFHKYASRETPDHIGIYAFDINTKKMLWENEQYVFLFIKDDKIYCFRNRFETREFFTLDYKSGVQLENLGEDATPINILRNDSFNVLNSGMYLFPEVHYSELSRGDETDDFLKEYQAANKVAGRIEFIKHGNMLYFNSHYKSGDGSLKNIFYAIEFSTKKVILEEVLNRQTSTFIPDCFFIKDNLLFLLIEKMKLKVYSIK